MHKSEIPQFDRNTLFKSISKSYMTFDEVFDEIIRFLKADADCSYRISVGTDSQVGNKTVLVSCIHVHRIGKGAIGFLHRTDMSRPVISLREKIYLETCASLQLAYMFDDGMIRRIQNIVNDTKKGVSFEFHIDIGTIGKTRKLINEMVGMANGLSFTPKIKPESYCASSFADRYTKAM